MDARKEQKQKDRQARKERKRQERLSHQLSLPLAVKTSAPAQSASAPKQANASVKHEQPVKLGNIPAKPQHKQQTRKPALKRIKASLRSAIETVTLQVWSIVSIDGPTARLMAFDLAFWIVALIGLFAIAIYAW